MGAPKLIPGGDTSINEGYSNSWGVFAKYPGATPKYALNEGQRDNEYRETMARLFIQMSEKERVQFVKSCPPETRPLARVLSGAGTGASGGRGFIDFLLTGVQEPFQEKVQVVESMSDNFVIYSFGQSAPTFTYSGVLLNTYQDDQRVWMMRLYQDILRATQLARRKKLVRIRYDSVIVSGVIVAHGQSLNSTLQTKADFSFQLIPTQYVIYTPAIGNPTELDTAFTEGGQYGLTSAKAPDTRQLRVARATSAGKKPKQPATVEKALAITHPETQRDDSKKKTKELKNRVTKEKTVTKVKDTREGIVSG